jgi:hypothetical protein
LQEKGFVHVLALKPFPVIFISFSPPSSPEPLSL